MIVVWFLIEKNAFAKYGHNGIEREPRLIFPVSYWETIFDGVSTGNGGLKVFSDPPDKGRSVARD